MKGSSYKLFGTDTVFEITDEDGGYWIITIRSPQGQQLGVRMQKPDFEDGVRYGKLSKVEVTPLDG
tara:strand:+ start:1304 stop:1501 length:198 start_codon:yes stop_codon:yes gene_type:complete